MALIPFTLKALRYSHADGFNPDDHEAVRALVIWLENTKVRRYPIDGRGALQTSDPAAWEAGFRQYLVDLECPIALEAGNRQAVLQWLLAHAVGLEYQDNTEGYRAAAAAAAAAAPPPEEWSEAQLPPFPDTAAGEVAAALGELQALLRGDGGVVTPATLAAARATLETQILPALAEMQRAAAAADGSSGGGGGGGAAAGLSAGQAAAAALLAKYPNGLSAEDGDAPTDLAATVLRMLYIKDLRGLQTAIDDAIVAVQEYTANPRTDAALGKVGR